MSHIHQGPLATYNSLTDGHLSGYFSNTRMRRHLRKSGLISKQGEIVSESTYRLNMSRKEHKKQVKDMLAQAIVHKTLDLERTRQAEIKKKLEEISKIQLVRRVREERTKVYEEMVLPLLSPRQGQGQTVLSARMKMKQSPRSQSTNTIPATHDRASTGRRGDEEILPYLTPRSRRPGSSPAFKPKGQKTQSKLRPNSAPGVRSESRHSEISVEEEGDVLYLDDDGRPITPAHQLSGEQSHIDSRHLHTLDTAAIRKYAMLMSQMEEGHGVTSPYMMSQVPLPPKARMSKPLLSSRRVQSASPKRPVTTTDGRIARLHRPETAKAHPGDQQTMCRVLMKYHGWALNLAREKMDPRQEVVVEQQHCGGNTLTVFKERLTPGSTFEFISYRHRGYPFSLTLYLDGQMDSRVSTCCEYRHSRGAKIGGKQGHFSLLSVEGAIPCYKCQVAKGVLVRNKATPRKSKRPSERHMEEVIVVATKKDDDDDYEDDDEGTERRTKQGKPVGEEDSAVLIPVERDEEENEDKTPKSTTERDTTYDDDFEDDKSASSKSSSESDSESESSRSNRKDEATKKGQKRNEDFRTMEVEERGEESEELSPTAPVGQEEETRGGDDRRTRPVKVINGTDREIDDYSSDNDDEVHKGKQINVENIEADDPVKIHHRSRTSSTSSHSSSTAPPTANLAPEEERGTDNTIINVDLVDREERGEEKSRKENKEREELRQKEEEEFLEQQRHEREERRASIRRASEVKRQEVLYQQQLLEAEQNKRERQKKVQHEEETIPSRDPPEEKRRQVMMVLEEPDSDSQQQSAPERRQEAAAKTDHTEFTAEVRQDVEDWEGNGGRYLQKVEEREDEEEESSEQGRPGDSTSHSQSSTARSLSPAPSSASSESTPQQRDVEDSKGLQAPDHSEMEPRRSASPAPAEGDSLTILAPDQAADADMEPPRAPSPFPPPAVYLHRRQTRTEENAHPAKAESPPSSGPLSPAPLTSEPAQFRPLSPVPPRAETDAPSEPPPRATSPFPSPAVYVDRPKRRPDAEPNVEGEQDKGRSHHTETSHSLASSTLSTTIVPSDPEDEPNTEDAGAHGREGEGEGDSDPAREHSQKMDME